MKDRKLMTKLNFDKRRKRAFNLNFFSTIKKVVSGLKLTFKKTQKLMPCRNTILTGCTVFLITKKESSTVVNVMLRFLPKSGKFFLIFRLLI